MELILSILMAGFLFSLGDIITILVLAILSICNASLWKGMHAISDKIASYSISFLVCLSTFIALLSIVVTLYVSIWYYQEVAYSWVWILIINLSSIGSMGLKLWYGNRTIKELKKNQS